MLRVTGAVFMHMLTYEQECRTGLALASWVNSKEQAGGDGRWPLGVVCA